MPIADCLAKIMDAGSLGRDDAEALLGRVDARAQRLIRTLGLGEDEALTRAVRDITEQANAVAAVQRRNALMNLQKRIARRARIEEVARAVGGSAGVDLVRGIRNTMVAINTPVRGGRMSAEAEGITWHDRYLSGLTNELDRAGLYGAARSNQFQRAWGRELYELSLRDAGEPANPGVTGNAHAVKIAAIVNKYMTWAKSNLNREGAWIGDYAGYINRTVHDGDKMRRAGPDAWMATLGPLLDQERTFEGVDHPGAMLRGVYNALVTGVHLSDADGVGFKDPAFTGPANIAKKMSEARTLHFRDADAWLDYQEKFGTGTLLEQVHSSLGRAAHSQALLSRFGTNPDAEFDTDIRWAQEKYRDTDTAAVDRLGQARKGLQAIFDTLTGKANRPENRLFAKISSYTRLDESMAKLGMVMFTHLSAMVNKAGELHYQGVPWAEAYGDFFASPFRSFSSAEASAWADETLAGMEGTNRDIISAFGPNDTVPGTASRLANLFFKMSGLTFLLNKQKAGAEWTLSRRAGMQFERPHDELPAPMQRILQAYDISPAEWEILRAAPGHAQIDGRSFLTPRAAARAPDAGYDAMLRGSGAIDDRTGETAAARRIADARDDLTMKVHAWLHDTADRSVVTPGAEDRALIQGGTNPGTIDGEFWRFVAQFKMWPVAAIRQQWGREIYGTPGDVAGRVSGIMSLMVGSLITGMAVMTIKDLLKGQTPRDPLSPATMAAAMMQGGGFGIAGDYLFGEYNRFGQSPTEAFLGPVLGQGATSALDLFNRIKSHAEGVDHTKDLAQDALPEAFRLLTDNLPFVNLFYTRQLFNYLFLHSLQETLNPGYLRRSEQSLRRKTGQTYILSPSENHFHTFGR